MEAQTQFPETQGQVISADGTVIGYRQFGSGPGLLVLHGGGRASQHYRGLAQSLADVYTVTIPDRRGRGLSGSITPDYNMVKACEDVKALMGATGANIVFGHSGGGLIALRSALVMPINTLLLYEPAISINGSLPLAWAADYVAALNRNDPAMAMAVFITGLPMNWMSKVPRWALAPLFRLMLRGDEGPEIVELLHTMPAELRMTETLDSTQDDYRKITARTLVMNGGKTPAYLRDVMPILAGIIPNAQHVELPGLDHSSPEEEGAAAIAQAMRQFLSVTAAKQSLAAVP